MDFDYKLMCRLCASSEIENMNDIFQEIQNDFNAVKLVKKYLDIVISEDDICPLMICGQCVETLNNFNLYAKKCQDVQEVFSKLYLNSKEVTEDDSRSKFVSSGTEPAVKIEIKVEPEISGIDSEHDYDDVNSNLSDDETLIKKVTKAKVKTEKGQPRPKLRNTRRSIKLNYKDDYGHDRNNEDSKKKTVSNMQNFINFKCNDCRRTFENWYRLKAHTQHEHRKTASVKCICGVTVKSKTAIYRHIASHKDPTCFRCTICPRVTKSEAALDRHKLRHIPKTELAFTCEHCQKIFQNKDALKSHVNVHMPRELRYIFPCKTCGKKFTHSSAALSHHRVVHEKLKRFICDLCGYACGTSSELSQHRAIHSDEKRFICPVCSKSFKTSSNLKTHTDIHDATSYPCPHCSKILNSRRTYRKHLLVHDGLCRHVCSFCGKAFKRRQTLKAHLNIHTGEKPVQCPWCPMKFRYSSSCRAHKQRAHTHQLLEADMARVDNHVTMGNGNEQKLCSATSMPVNETIQCPNCLITFLNILAYSAHKETCQLNNALFAKNNINLSDELEVVALQEANNPGVKSEMNSF